jgi:hypothetical protein
MLVLKPDPIDVAFRAAVDRLLAGRTVPVYFRTAATAWLNRHKT